MPAPNRSDSTNNLLAKILLNLGGSPSATDGEYNLTFRIASVLGANPNVGESKWGLLQKIAETGANKPQRGDGEYNLLYRFALNQGANPRPSDSKWNLLYRICYATIPPVYDDDALAFAAASGATDIANLSAFVEGVKSLGLWDSMVCWPLRSSQNAGTGSTAYSLGGLGTYNGTLVNGPTWGVDGLTILGSSSQSVTIGDDATLKRQNQVGLALVFSTASTSNFSNFGCLLGKTPGGAGFNHNYQWNERLNERNVSFSTGDGVSQVVNLNVALGANTDKHFLLGSAKAGDVSKVKHNANAIQSAANALTQFNATDDTLKFNLSGVGHADGGEFSFGALFASDLSDSQMTGLYSLYKSTLGQGLGLP